MRSSAETATIDAAPRRAAAPHHALRSGPARPAAGESAPITRLAARCIALAALLAAGCTGDPEVVNPINRYRAESETIRGVTRIALLPVDRGPASESSARLLADAVEAALAGEFDVVDFQPRRMGLVESKLTLLDALVEARTERGADAALAVRIVAWRPDDPPSVTMSMELISTSDARLLWSAAGTLDAAREDVRERVRRFCRGRAADEGLFGWRATLLAERRYAEFAAVEFLSTIDSPGHPRRF